MIPFCPECKSKSASADLGNNGKDVYGCEECSCIFLPCPVCGKVVCSFGSKPSDNTTCKHVVAWGTEGNNEIFWECDAEEGRFMKWYTRKYDAEEPEESEETVLEEYATPRRGLKYAYISEGGKHGVASYFVFDCSSLR